MNQTVSDFSWGVFSCACITSLILAGCAGKQVKPDDPWSGWNHDVQSFNNDFDDAIMKPLAKGYVKITPDAVDEGVTNFFSNMDDIGVSINDFLQLKFVQGGMDLGRFAINTTAGVLGVFDVAKKINLPKHQEDFGQTLGFWGVPSGPYMVLPFLGPSSPRDAVGLVGDALLDPMTYTFLISGGLVNALSLTSGALDATDTRAGLMSTEKMINEASVNRYEFIKDAYKQRREYLIHDGNPPESDDLLLEEAGLDSPATGGQSDNASNPAIPSQTGNAPANAVSGDGLPPVVNHSHHMLELSAPEEEIQPQK